MTRCMAWGFRVLLALTSVSSAWADNTPVAFTCANWVEPGLNHTLFGQLNSGSGAVESLSYSVPLMASRSTLLTGNLTNLSVALSTETGNPGQSSQVALYTAQTADGAIRAVRPDMSPFADALDRGTALATLIQLKVVLPSSSSSSTSGPPAGGYSIAKFRIQQFGGAYLDVVSLWNCKESAK